MSSVDINIDIYMTTTVSNTCCIKILAVFHFPNKLWVNGTDYNSVLQHTTGFLKVFLSSFCPILEHSRLFPPNHCSSRYIPFWYGYIQHDIFWKLRRQHFLQVFTFKDKVQIRSDCEFLILVVLTRAGDFLPPTSFPTATQSSSR